MPKVLHGSHQHAWPWPRRIVAQQDVVAAEPGCRLARWRVRVIIAQQLPVHAGIGMVDGEQVEVLLVEASQPDGPILVIVLVQRKS